ncbi:MAG: putative Ig domain-containing protein [Deltaproteobacteria bacterium]|nr:putative Ig domain-containing protein [Deltaproteobacteria bacterium]
MIAALLCSAGPAWAASLPYEVTVELASYAPISGGTVYTPTSYALGYEDTDEGAVEVPLPFPVEWFGRSFDSVFVYTNGFVSFSAPPPPPVGILGPPSEVPSFTNRPHDALGVLWANLQADPTTGRHPEIRVRTFGSAPSREVVIQVQDYRRSNVTGSRANFQVRFLEDGTLRAVIGPTALLTGGATVIEDQTGTLGANLLETGGSCGPSCACTPRTCSSTQWQEGLTISLERPLVPELLGTIDGPNGAYPNDVFTATVTLANLGQASAAATLGEIRISTDEVIDPFDVLVSTWAAPALAAGESASEVLSLTMPPLPVGKYFLGLISDASNGVVEAFEDNDTAIDPGGLASGPDLSVRVFSPLGSGPGEAIELRVDIVNRGAPVLSPVSIDVYLSNDDVLAPGDARLDGTFVSLPDGFSGSHTFHTTIPTDAIPSPPSYRILAAIDQLAEISEYDETNNIARTANVLTLAAADLEVVGYTLSTNAFVGLPYALDAEISNRGGAVARDFEICVVLSVDRQFDLTQDHVFVRRGPVLLRAGESITAHLEAVVSEDVPLGNYFVAVIADCGLVVSESVENNTLSSTAPILVREPAPDFLMEEVSAPATAAAGEVMPVSALVLNLGVTSAATHVRFVLSADQTLDESDVYLADSPDVEIGPSQDRLVSLWVEIPQTVTSGNWFLFATADPDDFVEEVTEGDETGLSASPITVLGADLAIVSPAPPNAVVGVPYTFRFAARGGSGGYVYELMWSEGSAPAGIGFDASRAELSGVAEDAAQGAHAFVLRVRSGGETSEMSASLLIVPPTLPLSIVSGKLPPARQREAYSSNVIAVGGVPPYVFEAGTGMPAGLELTHEGEVTGTPGSAGAYLFDVTVTDALLVSVTARLAIDVIDPAATVSITTADVPAGVAGEPYETRFESEGGSPPLLWTIEGQRVPGLEFIDEGAKLVGTPTVAGRYPFVVEVRDSRGLLDRNAYVLEIYEVGELEVSEAEPLPKATLGEPYADKDGNDVRLTAVTRSGAAPLGVTFQLVLGELPPGLELDSSSGVISGTPVVEGAFPFTVLAVDASGDFDRATFAIVVAKKAVTGGGDEGCSCATGRRDSNATALLGLLLALLLRRVRR